MAEPNDVGPKGDQCHDSKVQDQNPGQENLSGESDVEEKIPDEELDLQDKILSGEFKWMSRTYRTDPGEGTGSFAGPSKLTIPGIQELTPTQTEARAQDRNCQS